jgi:tetratricopeptide (TPR) repeat protein
LTANAPAQQLGQQPTGSISEQPKAAAPARPKRPFLTRTQRIFRLIGSIGDATIKLGLIAGFSTVAFLVYEAATSRNLSIEDIAVPEGLTERGYTSAVVARRIVDGIGVVNTTAVTTRSRAVRGDESPASKLPELSAPVGDVSLQTITRQLRRFIGRTDLTIYGEITSETVKIAPPVAAPATNRRRAADEDEPEKPEPEEKTFYRFVLRSQTGALSGAPLPARANIDEAIEDAAVRIIEHFDPYVAVSYYLRKADRANAMRMITVCLTNTVTDDDPWAKLAMGILYREIDRDQPKALAQFEKVHQEHPNFVFGATNLSATLRAMGRNQEALAMANKAVAMAPDNPNSHLQIGLTQRALRNYPAAVTAMEKTRNVEPTFERAYTNLAIVHGTDQRDVTRAIAVLNEGLRVLPRSYFLRTQMAFLLYREGQIAEAKAFAEAAAQIDPAKPNAWYQLARTADAEGKIEEMISLARRGAEASGRDVFGWQLMAELSVKNRRWSEAEEAARKAIALDPNNSLHHMRLGIALLELKKPREALVDLGKAVELQPSNARANAEYARALWSQPPRQRNVARAAQLMSAAFSGSAALRKDFAAQGFEIFNAEALRLEQLGRSETAIVYIDEAVALLPERAPETEATRFRLERRNARSAR